MKRTLLPLLLLISLIAKAQQILPEEERAQVIDEILLSMKF